MYTSKSTTIKTNAHNSRFSLENARNAPATLCDSCKEMTSVLTNLHQLSSASGYEHLSWEAIELFAGKGCRLCLLIYESTENSSAKSMESDFSVGYFHAQKRNQCDGEVPGDFDFDHLIWKQDLFVNTTLSVSADYGEWLNSLLTLLWSMIAIDCSRWSCG